MAEDRTMDRKQANSCGNSAGGGSVGVIVEGLSKNIKKERTHGSGQQCSDYRGWNGRGHSRKVVMEKIVLKIKIFKK